MKWENIDQGIEAVIQEYKNKNPYQVLEVTSFTPTEEIRRAYLKKIRTYHPDSTDPFLKGINEEISKIINSAYETIMKERHESR
jgi:curved DNA-binding protein CbpA